VTAPYAWALLLAALALAIDAAAASSPTSEWERRVPSPSLDPAAVIRIQVEALRANGLLNEGIKLTYSFASPENRRSTGPLGRFTAMIRSAPYDRLLNHRSARFGPLSVSGAKAFQTVTIVDKEGEETRYLWVLSRQSQGELKDCWMTDAVISSQNRAPRQLVRRAVKGVDGRFSI
jgi:hypothetical protein